MKLSKSLLPALATICLAACNTTTTTSKPKVAAPSNEEEKVIVIPRLKDPTSVHNGRLIAHPTRHDLGNYLTAGFPDSVQPLLTGEHILEVTSDTTKLHIKGDSCWLEYVSAGTLHSKKKDGSYFRNPSGANESSDTLRIR